MSGDKRWRLICYDVRDPKRYRRLYKIMRGHGRTVQYSIFRCRLDDRQLESLRWQLARILAPEDRLLVVDLCPGCASRVIAKNHVEGWSDVPASFAIVRRQAPADERRENAPAEGLTDGRDGVSRGASAQEDREFRKPK